MRKTNSFFIKSLIVIISILILSSFLIWLDTFFVLITPVKAVSVSPQNESQDVELNSSLTIKFSKPVKRQELQSVILPEVHGEWAFKEPLIKNHFFKVLVFTPVTGFDPKTQYQVQLKEIKGFGLDQSSSLNFTFKTRPSSQADLESNQEEDLEPQEKEVTILKIPLDWQDYPLSCEAASLKMALNGKGIYASENEIMGEIGYDLTLHQGSSWGDPYQAYVGKIDGKICQTGYGVYWGPVAKAAQNYCSAESFSNWKIEGLAQEIRLGNPVIVWGTLPVETLTDCSWYSSEGKYIKAFKETHVRLVVGFIGNSKNPSTIILNDPLAGRIYWSTSYFLENWKTFDYSGVVIR